MKLCPVCQNTYENSYRVCPRDNTPLHQSNTLEPGMIIRAKYKIESRLGGGGMAEVYRARHIAFGEEHAIKVVRASYADDETFNHRFRSEAVLTRKLRHPNAIEVQDFDTTEDGRPYIVMELVEGGDLRAILRNEAPLTPERTVHLACQAASALALADSLGITHRDIKPENILVAHDNLGHEIAKVVDFGIAHVKEGSQSLVDHTATRAGVMVGTPRYMSPEQAKGKVGDAIDGRADIYSLGVMMFEMLTGKLPFQSDSEAGFCVEHICTPPIPPHEAAPSLKIPVPLSMVVFKCMQKDREQRYRNMQELISALQGREVCNTDATVIASSPELPATVLEQAPETYQESAPPKETQPPLETQSNPRRASKRRTPLLFAAALLLIAALAGGTFLLRHPAASDDAVRTQVTQVLHQTLDARGVPVNCASCSSLQPHVDVSVEGGHVLLQGLLQDTAEIVAIHNGLALPIQGAKSITYNLQPVSGANTAEPGNRNSSKGVPAKAPANAPATVTPVVHPESKPAETTSKKALSEDESLAQEYVRSAEQMMQSGNFVSAENRFQMAVSLDSGNAAARAGLERARKAKAAAR